MYSAILYENVCAKCVPGARSKKPLGSTELQDKGAVLYVGETSRSVQERCKEHWSSYKGGKEDSHMLKHQWLEHGGEPAEFVMRVVGSRSTALSRQISEAVRIRRRGGEGRILNSRAEYNRSHIPRLQVEGEDISKKREEEREKEEAVESRVLDVEQLQWEQRKMKMVDKNRKEVVEQLRKSGAINERGGGEKRSIEGKKGGSRKRRKYALLDEDWGAPRNVTGEPKEGPVERGEEQIEQGIGGAGVNGGGEQVFPPSSPNGKQDGSEVFTPEKLPRISGVRALTQRSIYDYMAPVLDREEPFDKNTRVGQYDVTQYTDVCTDGVSCTGTTLDMMDGENEVIRNVDVLQTTPSMEHADKSAPDISFLPPQPSQDSMGVQSGATETTFNDVQGGNESDTTVHKMDGRWQHGMLDVNDASNGVCMNSDDQEVQSMNKNDKYERDDECEVLSTVVCTHSKKGICLVHNIKGDRREYKHKVWKQKKYGYGYVTCKKVVYSCPLSTEPSHTNGFDASKNSVKKPTEIEVVGLGSDNFQRGNVGGDNLLSGLRVKGTDLD